MILNKLSGIMEMPVRAIYSTGKLKKFISHKQINEIRPLNFHNTDTKIDRIYQHHELLKITVFVTRKVNRNI